MELVQQSSSGTHGGLVLRDVHYRGLVLRDVAWTRPPGRSVERARLGKGVCVAKKRTAYNTVQGGFQDILTAVALQYCAVCVPYCIDVFAFVCPI